MNKTTIKALESACERIDQERERINLCLSRLLGEATMDVARGHPGCEVTGLAAMGTWFIMVKVDGVKQYYYSHPGKSGETRFHPALEWFDDIWNDYQTYPTIRFDVDKGGKMTSREDW